MYIYVYIHVCVCIYVYIARVRAYNRGCGVREGEAAPPLRPLTHAVVSLSHSAAAASTSSSPSAAPHCLLISGSHGGEKEK